MSNEQKIPLQATVKGFGKVVKWGLAYWTVDLAKDNKAQAWDAGMLEQNYLAEQGTPEPSK
jgi:hypothetical protein